MRVGRHERGRLPAAPVSDSERAKTAAELQYTCRQWLVMWSPWRQTFTAFPCFTTSSSIIDEAEAEAFLKKIKQVELANAIGSVA